MSEGTGSTLAWPQDKRIVFFGDSITENGSYILFLESYMLKHAPGQRIEWINLGVSSETASGTSEPGHPFPRPCVHERLERGLQESKPDWVFLCYGMNDGIYYPLAEDRFQAYRDGIDKAVEQVRRIGARPILLTPPPFDAESVKGELQPADAAEFAFNRPYAGYNDVLGAYAEWLGQYGAEQGLTVVDLREPLMQHIQSARQADPAYTYGDGIHPGGDGHWVMARTIFSRVFHLELARVPEWVQREDGFIERQRARRKLLNAAWREHVGHTNPNKHEALPLAAAIEQAAELLPEVLELAAAEGGSAGLLRSERDGFERLDFYHEGRECILAVPKSAAPGKPWIWRTEFFDAFADADKALLELGWHIGYCRLSHLYGCPEVAGLMESFRAAVVSDYGLSAKPTLFGFSRGGLYALRYTSRYPQHVSALYLDAPVVSICSWPGGLGTGSGSPSGWRDCLAVHGLQADQAAEAAAELLESFVAAAVEAGANTNTNTNTDKDAGPIPVLLISGDSDRVVPYVENGAVLAERYMQRGGAVDIIIKPGCDHHPHSLEDVRPIVEFVRAHTK